jgi:hypothetical protein
MNYIEYAVKVYENGDKHWYLNGKLHREDGPAVEFANGDKHWWLNGKFHREGGPAIEYANGKKAWYLNDKLHREDGPAIEWASGTKYWYLNGENYSEADFKTELAKRKQPQPLSCEGKVVEIEGKKYRLTEVIP